jgi:hypothetical protein
VPGPAQLCPGDIEPHEADRLMRSVDAELVLRFGLKRAEPGDRCRLQALPLIAYCHANVGRDALRQIDWMSVAREPSGPGGLMVTCGSEISSATNGSSVNIVAGKKRWPARPCANTTEFPERRMTAAGTAALHRVRSIFGVPYPERADDRPTASPAWARHRVIDRAKGGLNR